MKMTYSAVTLLGAVPGEDRLHFDENVKAEELNAGLHVA